MTRMMLDCRAMPSDSGCTLTLFGEQDELIRAGAAHAVDAHDHTDGPELRDALRGALTEAVESPTEAGAFVQLIEVRTRRADDLFALDDRWAQSIGDARTTRWMIRATDRDRPDTYLAIVEFPSYEAAMANSNHPTTAEFAGQLAKLCDEEPVFRNLDVLSTGA